MKRWMVIVVVIAVILTVASARLDFFQNALGRSDDRALEAAARTLHGVVGSRVSQRKIVSSLSPALKDFVAGVTKASPRAKVDSAFTATVKVEDTAKIVPVARDGRTLMCDEYKRFCFELPSGILTRRQLFRMETVFVRSPDGKTRVAKADFFEYNPDTKEMIPSKGVDLNGDFQFVDEKAELPPIFHLRPVVAVDHRLAFGAGLELLNLERIQRPVLDRLTLSMLGYYKDKEWRAVGQLGYRVYGNVTIGPNLGVTTDGTVVFGAGAAIQVGR
jgi:hypothetical protein